MGEDLPLSYEYFIFCKRFSTSFKRRKLMDVCGRRDGIVLYGEETEGKQRRNRKGSLCLRVGDKVLR